MKVNRVNHFLLNDNPGRPLRGGDIYIGLGFFFFFFRVGSEHRSDGSSREENFRKRKPRKRKH